MQTQRLSIHDSAAFRRALVYLEEGRAIVAPTDTVYGVMCRFDDNAAISRLYEIKKRPLDRAIPVLIGDTDQLSQIAPSPLPGLANLLADHFWPGPLTLIVPALPDLPPNLTAGQATVAVRMPDHRLLRRLISQSGPLAATSANLSGGAETHTAEAVIEQLGGRVPLVLADTPEREALASVRVSASSTIVDVNSAERDTIRLLRAGPIADEVCALLARQPESTC